MPHLIIELDKQTADQHDLQNLCERFHHQLCKTELFRPEQIKVRAYLMAANTKNGQQSNVAHLTLKLLAGRTTEQKQSAAKILIQTLSEYFPAAEKTVEIMDISEVYLKAPAS